MLARKAARAVPAVPLSILTVPSAALRPAAVLVPLIDRTQGLSVLLTQRTPHLSAHAGQIAFPGGRIEESDADAVEAALRETEEEVGLRIRLLEESAACLDCGSVWDKGTIGLLAEEIRLATEGRGALKSLEETA